MFLRGKKKGEKMLGEMIPYLCTRGHCKSRAASLLAVTRPEEEMQFGTNTYEGKWCALSYLRLAYVS